MTKNVVLTYVTFARDHDWLIKSLDSFRKYAKGFAGVTIVVPTWDVDQFLHFEKEYSTPACPVWIKNFLEYPSKGFVHHLAMKCYADVFSPAADFILYMDPDCLFSAPVTPDDYFVDGKPVLVIEPYEAIKEIHPGRYHWKSVTEMALKFDCPYEMMCRHPAVHSRKVLRGLRDYMESQHQTPFLDFVLKQKNPFPSDFGEFNTLGAFAYKFHQDEYFFIDRGTKGGSADPISKVTQLWSYTGVWTSKNQETIQKILA